MILSPAALAVVMCHSLLVGWCVGRYQGYMKAKSIYTSNKEESFR